MPFCPNSSLFLKIDTYLTHNYPMDSTTHLTITLSRGWLTTFATSAIGLALGILYVWSVIKSGIPDAWSWSNADKALPYSIMAIVFSFSMVPAGRLQDIIGPRRVILIGGFLTGLGCIIAGLGGDSKLAYVIGFGVVTGFGVGCGYCALAPSAMRWFPPQQTGLIVGIVVAGTGLSPVFLAPLSAWSLDFFQFVNDAGVIEKGISSTMVTLGLCVWCVVGLCVGLIQIPPVGYIPGLDTMSSSARRANSRGMTWKQMISTSQFWLLFFMFFAGSSTGLVFISVASDIGRNSLGSYAFLAVIVLSFGNSGGRILGGLLSDKIGRQLTMFCEFACQGLVVCLLFWLSKQGGGSWPVVLFVVFMIGLNYGSNHALFPATCKDFYGLEHFGINYGMLFCAFGTAGLIMPWLNGYLQDITGKPDTSYLLIIAMLAAASVLALVSRKLGPPEIQNS